MMVAFSSTENKFKLLEISLRIAANNAFLNVLLCAFPFQVNSFKNYLS